MIPFEAEINLKTQKILGSYGIICKLDDCCKAVWESLLLLVLWVYLNVICKSGTLSLTKASERYRRHCKLHANTKCD